MILWVDLDAKRKEARGFSVNIKQFTVLGLKCTIVQHENCVVFQDLQLSCCANFQWIKGF